MTIQTVADITGDNAAHAIGAVGLRARRIFLTASGGTARFGDANVGVARGVLLPQSVEVTISASDADPSDGIDLSAVKAYIPSGTTLTIAYGV